MTKILIKRLFDTVSLPRYETSGSSGMDISAHIKEKIILKSGEKTLVPTGFSLAVPEGFEVQIRPRSGLAIKNGISVLNTPGTIDADYRGEIKVILINLSQEEFVIDNGLRIAQMVICPVVQGKLELVKELPKTTRGLGGFGSTGTN